MDEKKNFQQPKLFASQLSNSAQGKYEKGENINQKDFGYQMDVFFKGPFSQPETQIFVPEKKKKSRNFHAGPNRNDFMPVFSSAPEPENPHPWPEGHVLTLGCARRQRPGDPCQG